jgi:hypothetical protein
MFDCREKYPTVVPCVVQQYENFPMMLEQK